VLLEQNGAQSRRPEPDDFHSRPWVESDLDQPPIPVFDEFSGLTIPIDETSTALDCFSHFFDIEVMRVIKQETNRYARESIDKLKTLGKLKPNSIWHKWTIVTLSELYKFFAIVLHMCLIRKPRLCHYWSTNPVLQSSFACKLMSRDRFMSILSMLHIADNSQFIPRHMEGHDPLHKLRFFYDKFIERSKQALKPNENLTVDEGMCPFRGRLAFKVYIKNKPHKYGVKFFTLCDAKTGYILNIEMYAGKQANISNATVDLFNRLCGDYFHKNHTIYMDRFYTSPLLFHELWKNNTLAVGTLQSNRKGLSKDLVRQKLKKNQLSFRRKDHLFFLKWKDNRDVFMLSTRHRMTATNVPVRTKFGIQDKMKPDVIIDYNNNKTGVDHSDQLMSYYPFDRRQVKWWKKVFFHMFMMMVVNSFIIHKSTQKKSVHLVEYVTKLSEMLADKGGLENENLATVSTSANRLSARHFPEKIPPTENSSTPQRRCKVCSSKSKTISGKALRKDTRYYCKECNVGLCFPECFRIYHTRANITN
jgi:hypothetical protein